MFYIIHSYNSNDQLDETKPCVCVCVKTSALIYCGWVKGKMNYPRILHTFMFYKSKIYIQIAMMNLNNQECVCICYIC